jgi:hypothetical protein
MPASICGASEAYGLSGGLPAGGTYSGPFVANGEFDAGAAGAGTYVLSYSQVYTYPNTTFTCADQAQVSLTVATAPVVSCNLPVNDLCTDNEPLLLTGGLPTGGSYFAAAPYGFAVVGNTLNVANLGAGGYAIGYTYTDNNGCTATGYDTVQVHLLPSVAWNFEAVEVCADAAAITLPAGAPAGGVYTGAGLSGQVFDPAIAGIGVHNLQYTVTNAFGCTATNGNTATVFALPEAAWVPSNYTYCPDDSNEYVLQWLFNCSEQAVFSGTGVQNINGGQFFVPATVGGEGTFVVTGTCTDANGCQTTIEKAFVVEACLSANDPTPADVQVHAAQGQLNVLSAFNAEVLVTNSIGQVLTRSHVYAATPWRTDTLPAGMYVVHVRTSRQSVATRVVLY